MQLNIFRFRPGCLYGMEIQQKIRKISGLHDNNNNIAVL